jgi:hypothetical protein
LFKGTTDQRNSKAKPFSIHAKWRFALEPDSTNRQDSRSICYSARRSFYQASKRPREHGKQSK